MNDSRINPSTITGRINAKALDLLDENPEGLRWVDLASMIKRSDSNLHPKTVNGCIWKLNEKFPDKVYKPTKGFFRLIKYKK
jgi:SLT domain-containing protein